jgi:hypothetical protein
MSDPHYTDPRYTDQRRVDLESPSSAGSMWTWLAALVAVVVVLGLAIGYNRTEEASNRPATPTTTGAAPSTPRPATPANPAGNAAQPAPARPASPAPADGVR